MLGLEVTSRDWMQGQTNGSYGHKTYFRADRSKGVICDVSMVAVEDIHSKERLESLNKGTVERIALIMDKTSLTDNNNVKNVNMNEEYGKEDRSGYGRPAKIENYSLAVRGGRGGGGHSNIHRVGTGFIYHHVMLPSLFIMYCWVGMTFRDSKSAGIYGSGGCVIFILNL